jgi:hypothetical protein
VVAACLRASGLGLVQTLTPVKSIGAETRDLRHPGSLAIDAFRPTSLS